MCSNDLSIVFFVMKKHYLYAHTRNDTWSVFYIGIGTHWVNKNYHRSKVYTDRNSMRKHIYNKYWRSVHIVYECNNYDYIKHKEQLYIAYYGRDQLANFTDWWDWALWYIMKEDQRNIIKDRMQKNTIRVGRKHSEETKEKMRQLKMWKCFLTEEWRRRKSEAMKWNKHLLWIPWVKKSVAQYSLDGEPIKIYDSILEASLETGASQWNICSCCKNKLKRTKWYIRKYN